jgi:transposase-like protein
MIRAEYESGEKVATLAARHGVADRTIHRWKESEDWQRSDHLAADTILQRARNLIEQRVETSTVEVTAEIEGVVARHKAATSTLMGMMNEALARAMAYPNEDPFKQLLVIKVASEIVKNVSFMDRKTWGLDDRAKTSTTAIYEVLSDMETTAEKKALRIEEKY